MKSLPGEFLKEQARVRAVQGYYLALGMPGKFGYLMIERVLRNADDAVMSGDPAAMIMAYKELQEVH